MQPAAAPPKVYPSRPEAPPDAMTSFTDFFVATNCDVKIISAESTKCCLGSA